MAANNKLEERIEFIVEQQAKRGRVMKRLATVLSVLLITAIAGFAQQGEKRRFGAPAYWGPVRTVRVERAKITNQNGTLIEGPRTLLQTIIYNEEGSRKEVTVYRPDGAISGKSIDTYDPEGRILETDTVRGNGDPGNRMVSSYDGNKRLIEKIIYRPDGSVSGRITFVYQDNKRIHTSVSYDQNGVIVTEVTGTLDLKMHRMEAISQNGNQVVQRESSFTDTPQGQVYEEQVNGTRTRHTLNRPTGNGGPELIEYNPDGAVGSKQRWKTEDDSHGNSVKTITFVANGDSGNFQPAEVLYLTFEYYGKN
jgi:antitoxin component YwqK of YwqJK toxin-antitoxin module